MAEQHVRESPDEQVLRHALEKLRARDGLTITRLRATAADAAAPLLRLKAVRRYANVHGVDQFAAARAVVAECLRIELPGTHRIVADAVLAAGVFTDAYARHGIEPRMVDGLRSDMLSRRRACLLAGWEPLHAALGLRAGDAPSDRSLRGTVEGQVLAELARQLMRRDVYSLGSASAPGPDPDGPAPDALGPGGRVIVVGAAVMDAVFQTRTLPQLETSSEAYGFELSPGGKGLNQAVAAARLGLDVSLLAAVTDDRFGEEITAYLTREHVDTSMLKYVSDASTPFTGVFEFELGDSIAVNWRNDRDVRLDTRDIEQAAVRLRESDVVLMTFEVPRESLQHALALLADGGHPGQRPQIIVTPGQPYSDGAISGQALARIDYIVGLAWELGRLAPATYGKFDVDVTSRQLLAFGVDTLCIPAGGGCTIFSEQLGTFTVPMFPSQYKESSASRDAFCAALAAKLIERAGEFSADVALWATAAMAAATADFPAPNPMPTRQRVNQLLARSWFRVSPNSAPFAARDTGEPAPVSDAAGGSESPGGAAGPWPG
ncbi:MAG: PfkB family carbohydrate kinase [Streptosporangiaceae bacterium]